VHCRGPPVDVAIAYPNLLALPLLETPDQMLRWVLLLATIELTPTD